MKYLGPTSRPRLNEAIAVVCLFIGLFVLVSLVSYNPLDPSWNTATAAAKPANLTGRLGALAADFLLQAFGIGEIVVKNGPNSALVAAGGAQEFVPVPEVMVPIDATAAGDGCNAGYLAARLSGADAAQAASAAHRLAGNVIRHQGALVPRAAAALH